MAPEYFDNQMREIRAFGASGIEGGIGRIKPIRSQVCQSCGGSGFDGPPEYEDPCPACYGQGTKPNGPRGIDWGSDQ